MRCILSIDQSTSGTKALLLDEEGVLIGRSDLPHAQKVNEKGWVSHDPMEIYRNTLRAAETLLEDIGICRGEVAAIGISNRRETSLIWDRDTGLPVADAVVWRCDRAAEFCERLSAHAREVRKKPACSSPPIFQRPNGPSCWKISRALPAGGSLQAR